MKDTYNIAGRFCINVISKNGTHFAAFLKNEYRDFLLDDKDSKTSCVGTVQEVEGFFFKGGLRELVKDWLYEDCEYIFLKYNSKYARFNLTDVSFEIFYQKGFENSVLFHFLEDIIRLYVHCHGIDFFHASSFTYDGKVVMLNGFGGSGKTEIMVDFLLRGAAFISDDLVLINEQGKIFPYRVTIPLRWNVVTPEFVDRKKVPTIIYKVCKYCHSNPGRITNRIYGKLVWRFLIGDHTYRQLSDIDAQLKFNEVDHCYWLQESNVFKTFKFSNVDFLNYMNVCLENESRKYFDIEGFLALKFPEVNRLIEGRQQLRERICRVLTPSGLTVESRDYNQTINYLLRSIK